MGLTLFFSNEKKKLDAKLEQSTGVLVYRDLFFK